jgi:hypothetical protein
MVLTNINVIEKIKWSDSILFSCDYCGETFYRSKKYYKTKNSTNHYCDNKCQAKHIKGIKFTETCQLKHKTCKTCNLEKMVDEFPKNSRGYYKPKCKECTKINNRLRYRLKKGIIDKQENNKICISCSVIIDKNNKSKYCCECKKFVYYKKLFEKFGFLDKNLKEVNKKTLEIICEEYFINNLSLIELKNKYGVMYNTIHFYLKKNDINLRNLTDSLNLAYLTGRLSVKSDVRYKQGWHKTWDGKQVFYHSSYELEYAKKLDEQKISYEMESLRIRYFDTQKNKERIAIPDFYIPSTNTIIEIKSNHTLDEQNMLDRVSEFKKLGFNFKLILEGLEKIY